MVATTAMDVARDRRLSISKSSSKISKRSAPPAPPSRPSPRIVTVDSSSFRRVVQELTGSATPSPPPPPPPRSSRLQRIAPPPLTPHLNKPSRAPDRQLLDAHLHRQQHQLRHRHQQQQQQQLMAMALPPPLSPLARLHPPLLRASPSSPLLPGQFPHPLLSPLPMLSPLLFSPLPSLTPGDNAWACPFDVLPPASVPSPYPLPLPPPARIGDSASIGVIEYPERGPPPPPSLPQVPISPAARFSWPPPWSPIFPVSPVPPIYPGYLPSSPGFGISNLLSGISAANGVVNFSSPSDFTFQSPSDYGFFKPS